MTPLETAMRDWQESRRRYDDATLALARLLGLRTDPAGVTPPRIFLIQSAVAGHYGVRAEALAEPIRTETFVLPRHVAMYLCRVLTNYSYEQIGAAFHRDHGAVLNGVRRITQRIDQDKRVAASVASLKAALAEQLNNLELPIFCRGKAA